MANQDPWPKAFASGATADVYAWSEGWILKLFHLGRSKAYVEGEARVALAVQEAVRQIGALRVPAVGPVVEVAGRYGLLYERISGRSMLEALLQMLPHSVVAYARQLAELHAAIHAIPATTLTDLPVQQDRLHQRLATAKGVSAQLREAVQERLAGLVGTEWRLCHGDFHPGNVLLTDDLQAVIIDWHDATRGDPLADVARTSLLLDVSAASPSEVKNSGFEPVRNAFHDAYLTRYFDLRPVEEGRAKVKCWLPVIAAARLREGVAAAAEEQLLSIVGAHFG